MNLSARKTEITRATSPLILRHGVRAVRIDDIAKTLGISKRTIYEIFSTKTELISGSLREIIYNFQQEFAQCLVSSGINPLISVLIQTQTYIQILYNTERNFWNDLAHLPACHVFYDKLKNNWLAEICKTLACARDKGYIIPDTDIVPFTQMLQHTIYEGRLNQYPRHDQLMISYIMIRGIAFGPGLIKLDAIRKAYISENEKQNGHMASRT